jgi:hypothetical protein
MNKIFLALTSLAIASQGLHAQFRTLTSASDIGRLNSSVFSQNRFAGQLSAAYVGNMVTNFQNPASYADASLTSIEIGAHSISGSYHIGDSTKSSGGLGINHFAMQFPLTTGKSGMSFGFVKNSNTDYSIKKVSTDNTFGSFSNQLSGLGNTYQAFIGTGFRFKNLKLGANLGLNFGQTEHNNDFVFPDSSFLPKIATKNSVSEFGVQYTLGAQYELEASKTRQIVFGAYYTSALSHSATNELKKQNVFDRSGTLEYITLKDSTFDSDLPKYSKLGLGISMIQNRTTLIGAEFNLENFSAFKSKLDSQSLQNAWHLHLGGEYKPFMNRDVNSRKYFNRLTYRLGAVLGKSEQNFSGTLNDIRVMGGVTLPVLSRNIGFISLGTEYGIRGFGGDKTQLSENYFNIHLILTFADKWFMRQKFD